MPSISALPRRSALAALTAVALAAVSACAGGPSDVPRSQRTETVGATTTTTLNLFAYGVPKPGYDKVIPGFQATDAGRGVAFQPSFGASGDQSRKVRDGAPADLVSFSVEPEITALVDAGLVAKDWNQGEHNGVPFGSIVTIVVRQGNPKGIRGWDDLLRPDVTVVTPNPFSSGSAKWNLLAPYAAKSRGGADSAAGLAYVDSLVREHVKIQPKSGREASEAFLQGSGDVLLSYENEALFLERTGEKVEHVVPEQSFRVDNPVAVVSTTAHPEQADDFLQYLYSDAAQRLWAQAGFRPVEPAVRAEFADTFPDPPSLYSIDDLGGWAAVDRRLFDPTDGAIAAIYAQATR